ncbi:MAG TPA: NAD-dependent epimerase/dehydratase family protein [Propionibacteriaceae bacterium]|nr:NAD-dependent epimerase/dehydratase family protein [Propionibacteriaceae bacterium]
MKVAVTGADGFLGWHLRVRAKALRPDLEVVPVTHGDWPRLSELLAGVDAVVHVAGINRDTDEAVRDGNIALARDVVAAVHGTPRVVYANSIQVGNGSPYAIGKAGAADVLGEACAGWGSAFTDVRLPNLFGEHGRSSYNSFVATFAAAAVRGETPSVADRPIGLLHAQQAAQALLDGLNGSGVVEPLAHPTSVGEVWDTFAEFRSVYSGADVPDVTDPFRLDLFNTYRAAMFPLGYPQPLVPRSDQRGRLVESIRSHGAGGQVFVSTTNEGFTRGEHFHLRKIERFVVLAGRAEIALRRELTDEVVSFVVSGDEPVAVDMPTMWTHNITALGGEATTLFWTNELYDPEAPDTYWEDVRPKPVV